MISRYEVSQLIDDAMKNNGKRIQQHSQGFYLDLSLDMYTSIHELTTLAKKAAVSEDLILYKRCLALAERLHKDGEQLVKDVVENIFIYELSSTVAKGMLPRAFYQVYLNQVMKSY
jgi:hypothetical protein